MVQDLVHDPRTDSAKSWAQGLYIAHGVCLLFTLGTLSFIPLIFNYVKRPEAAGTFVHTHHDWQIRSFWWYVVWVVVGWILVFTIVGILRPDFPFPVRDADVITAWAPGASACSAWRSASR